MKIRCKCDRLRWLCPGEGTTGCDLEDLSCGRALPLPNFRTVSAFPETTYRRMWAPSGTPLYPMENEHPRERAARIEWWWRVVDAGLVVCLVAILATIAFKFCKIKGWL